MAALNDDERRVVIDLIDDISSLAYDRGFWALDTAEVFDIVSNRFIIAMAGAGLPTAHWQRCGFFMIVSLNFAVSARESGQMRRFAGIRKGLFW